ncbi:ankyrin repeat domain-containing protein [Candidatus Dependentiae bacterium]|nr:ankyrin repeat domain-containing protein [Candidatus Dependentiae bacterium]
MKAKLIIFAILSVVNLTAMQQASLMQLPGDLQIEITKILTHSNTQEEAIQAIKALAQANKYFNQLINGENITNYIITNLANKFENGNRINAAFNLGTLGAQKWFSTQSAKDWFKEFSKNNNAPAQFFKDLLDEYERTKSGKTSAKIVALLEIGVSPNIPVIGPLSKTPLEIALEQNDKILFKALLKAGVNPNERNVNPHKTEPQSILEMAAAQKKYDFVKILLEAKATPNPRNPWTKRSLLQELRDDLKRTSDQTEKDNLKKIIELIEEYIKRK